MSALDADGLTRWYAFLVTADPAACAETPADSDTQRLLYVTLTVADVTKVRYSRERLHTQRAAPKLGSSARRCGALA